MTICTLEVRTARLDFRRDIPAPASFVGDERKVVMGCNLTDKGRVGLDGTQSVGDGER